MAFGILQQTYVISRHFPDSGNMGRIRVKMDSFTAQVNPMVTTRRFHICLVQPLKRKSRLQQSTYFKTSFLIFEKIRYENS